MSQHDVQSSNQLSFEQMNTDQSSLKQSNSNQVTHTNSNQSSKNQIDQSINNDVNEARSSNDENQTVLINETNSIDLSTSSEKLEELFTRKRKTKKIRQIALKKKFETVKISTLVLSVDEALKNAQKSLFEELKIAKTKHVILQQLINQIERARTNLDLTDKTSIAIDQVQTEKIFEFASIDLTKKSNKSTSYCETMSENFQHLEKTMKQKMTKLIIERLNQSIRSSSNANVNTTKKFSTNTAKA